MYIFYMFQHMYMATGRSRQNVDDNRKAFSLCPYVASFKMISSKSDFIHIFFFSFFMILYMYIAQGQGQKTPWRQTFDVTESPYHLDHLLQVTKKIYIYITYIYIFFNVFPQVYIYPRG